MQLLYDWVRAVSLYLIFSLLLEQLISDKYAKYIRLFTGMLLILLILRPILSWNDLDQKWTTLLEQRTRELDLTYLEEDLNHSDQQSSVVLSRQFAQMSKETASSIVQEYGYRIVSIDTDMEEDPEAENFGTIYSMELHICPEDPQQAIWIEPVRIAQTEERLPVSKDYTLLRQELAGQFAVDEKNIRLYITDSHNAGTD